MTTDPKPSATHNPPVESTGSDAMDAAIVEWFALVERGATTTPEEFLARYPDHAPQLREFLAAQQGFQRMAQDIGATPVCPKSVDVQEPTINCPAATAGAEVGPGPAAESHSSVDIGGYEVLHEIARGGMGVVFKGRDPDLKRDVAVKVLLERHQGTTELAQRFVEEAQIAGQLQHPGVTPVYELGVCPDRRPFFAMKLVKGETLAALLSQRASMPDDRQRFLKIFEQVCQTLAYAHSRGVIHRDLKPSNIMVGAFGEVQVMDWGLAKVLAEGNIPHAALANVSIIRTARSGGPDDATASDSQTQVGSVLGTLAYMPPEQALGEVDNLDQRSDVFGLGAILCEILTGQPPYIASSFEQLRRKAIRAELTDALERLAGCGADDELISLARRSLAPEPADRPADAGVLARELTAYREGVELRLREAELAEAQAVTRAVAERARRRLTVMFSSAVLTVLLIGVIGTAFGLVRARRALLAEEKERARADASAKAANESARAELAAKEQLRRELYVADLQLANQIWESGNGPAKTVAGLLAGQIPAAGHEDLREFAWRLQWAALHRNALELKGHDRGARLAQFATNGELITLDGRMTLRRWRTPDGTILKETQLQDAALASCWSISNDAQRIALGCGNRIQVYDAKTGERQHLHSGHALALGVSFSADGHQLAAAWSDGRVQVWKADTGKESIQLLVKQPEQLQLLERIQFAADGKSVYLLDYPDSSAVTCLTIDGEELPCPMGHRSSAYSIAVTPEGTLRATGDANGQVCLSEGVSQPAADTCLRVHRGAVSALAFSPDGHRLATGGADGTVTVWDVGNRQQILTLKGHLDRIQALSFSADGSLVASASEDDTVRVWSLSNTPSPKIFGEQDLPVFSVAYSPGGNQLAVGTGSGTDAPGGIVKIWDVAAGKLVRSFRAGDGRVLDLAYTPDGSRLVTGGYDSHVRVWNATTAEELHSLPGLNSEPARSFRQVAIGAVTVSPDGTLVAAGFGHATFHQPDYEQVVKVWELATGRELQTLTGHFNTIGDVVFSPDGKLLASASDDHQVKLWSTADWQLVRTLSGTERVKSVTFSTDGLWLTTGDVRGVVTIWDIGSGQPLKALRGHAEAVQRIVFSPDGKTLATASWDNTIKLWEPITGRELRTLRDHQDWISCLAFAPDGNLLATGSFDATVRLWTAASDSEITESNRFDKLRLDETEVRERQERFARKDRSALSLTRRQLDACSGAYDRGLIVRTDSDHLAVRPIEGIAGEWVHLYAQSETAFFARDRELDVTFLKGDDGDVLRAIIHQHGRASEFQKLDPHSNTLNKEQRPQ